MIENIQEIRILYSDTDAYGVVWHGAYVKWFEAGRVYFMEQLGFDIKKLEADNVLFPVVDLNIRYKSSAKLNENIVIKTSIEELKPMSIKFLHKVFNKETNELRIIANSKIVAINAQSGKLYREMPANIYSQLLTCI